MQGYQLTFFTQQNHTHNQKTLSAWLFEEALSMGIRGATLLPAAEGFGRHHHIHTSKYVELQEQPIEVTMAVSKEEAESFLNLISKNKIKVFYIKTPIEFGITG